MGNPQDSGANGPDSPFPEKPSLFARLRKAVIGPPRDLSDRTIFHRLSVVAFLAWVGLGADGLSSSSYGPEEAFRTLGEHTYLALPIAVLMMATVFLISACYSRIISRFPHGGGGYVVATALLGERTGMVSGSALLVDYVLTITVSIAAAGDALFSILPPGWQELKLPVEVILILALTTLNIRGVKESIITLLPVFLLFLVTHIILIGFGLGSHTSEIVRTTEEVQAGFRNGLATLGAGGMFLLFMHAYSLGGGTYTGLEAVSNGLPIMREPRVKTAQRTMIYMAVSLALTAGGLIICYLLWQVQMVPGKTLNAVLSERVAERLPLGHLFVILTLFSEGALLVVGAQAGFLDGPRVLANMAIDNWMPRRLAALSERLTTQNGILIMGGSALAALLYTRGDVRHLVVMYSINVFLTFSLSMLGMARSLLSRRGSEEPWKKEFALFAGGFIFCFTILFVTIFEKFGEGGWVTLLVTGTVVSLCFLVRRHYRTTNAKLSQLYAILSEIPRMTDKAPAPPDPSQPTAAVLVGGYTGLGIHTTLAAFREFPGKFKNVVFISVGAIDSGAFKGEDAVDRLRDRIQKELEKYVDLMSGQGVPATYKLAVGTDVVSELERLCLEVAREFPQVTYFAGQLIFQRERWYQPILHNETAYILEKRLHLAGRTMVIIPGRVG
ncbi:MAG: APC family permease [bacterium]|nr:APC family permease [bacterium]